MSFGGGWLKFHTLRHPFSKLLDRDRGTMPSVDRIRGLHSAVS